MLNLPLGHHYLTSSVVTGELVGTVGFVCSVLVSVISLNVTLSPVVARTEVISHGDYHLSHDQWYKIALKVKVGARELLHDIYYKT